jgi:hypothetical protein
MIRVEVFLVAERDIEDGDKLALLLNNDYAQVKRGIMTYVAVKLEAGVFESIERKCDFEYSRGSGCRLENFSKSINFSHVEVNKITYIVIGPGETMRPFAGLDEIKTKLSKTIDAPPSEHMLKILLIRSKKNGDGGFMTRGIGDCKETYYCGEEKKATSFIQLTPKLNHPDDDICGPNDGMQCIACKIVQDADTFGNINQGNCHKDFMEKIQRWTRDIRKTPDTIVEVGNVCNSRMNSNQSSKIIFCTALEMIQSHCDSTRVRDSNGVLDKKIGLKYDVTDVKFTIGTAMGIVTIEDLEDPIDLNQIVIHIQCRQMQTEEGNIEEYNNIRTECKFEVEYF